MELLAHEPRVVVVGYGWWGRLCHCYLVRTTPGLRLHGVVSSTAEKRAQAEREQGCRGYQSVTAAVADPDVDVLILSTPSSTHAPLAVEALRGGKHVVTEKVMCLDLAECDRMIKAAQDSGRLLTVFQNRRLDGDYLTVKALLDRGELGDVRWCELSWQAFGPSGGWRGRADMGGGRMYDLGAHLLDQLLLLLPEPVHSVYCRQHRDYESADIDSEALIVVTFVGGRTGVIDCSGMSAIPKPRFCLHGSTASFVKYGLDPQEAAMKNGDIDQAREDERNYGQIRGRDGQRTVPTLSGRWRTYFENLRDSLTAGAEPLVKLEEARRVMSVFDAARRSAATGEVVRWP